MSAERVTTTAVVSALMPIMAVVVVAYLVTGIAMPVLPLHVHQGLGLSTFVVGLVAGTQFAATLLSRLWAGRFADTRGSKLAVIAGLSVAGAAGLLYVLSVQLVATPEASVAVLMLGRALLGVMESVDRESQRYRHWKTLRGRPDGPPPDGAVILENSYGNERTC